MIVHSGMKNYSEQAFPSDFVSVRCSEEGRGYCSQCISLPSDLGCGWCLSTGECTLKKLCKGTSGDGNGGWLSSGSTCPLEDIIGLLTILTIIALIIVLVVLLYFIVLICDQLTSTWIKRKNNNNDNKRGTMEVKDPDEMSARISREICCGRSYRISSRQQTGSKYYKRPEMAHHVVDDDNSSIPSSSFQGTMILDKRASKLVQQRPKLYPKAESTLSSASESKVQRCYFQKYPSSNEPDMCTWSRREISDRILTQGSVLFYQTQEEISTKRCSLLTTTTKTSGDNQDMPFSCQTSLVPITNTQFYLVVQINVDPATNKYLNTTAIQAS